MTIRSKTTRTILLAIAAVVVLAALVLVIRRFTLDASSQIAAPGTTLTGWTLQLVNTPAAIPITTVDESRFVQFGVLSTAGAATGSIVFRIKRRGATADQTKEYGLELWQ